MTEQPASKSKLHKRSRKVAKKAVHLTAREYLPMGATLAFWALAALTIGHADAARLLSATVLLRAVIMLADLATAGPLKARLHAPPAILRRSRQRAALMQLGSLAVATAAIAVIAYGLERAGLDKLAMFLPLVAIGLPARAFRNTDPKGSTAYFRLVISCAALAAGFVAWVLRGDAVTMAFAYGLREWIATLFIALIPRTPSDPPRPNDELLSFPEVARNTVVTSRRLLTYRLTKNILTVFGPFGNFAARTGRGLNWHNRLEPYMPHKRPGFVLFALLTGGIAVFLAVRSGEPAALVASAGLLQLCAIAVNVLALWRYLPDRDDPTLVIEDSEDE